MTGRKNITAAYIDGFVKAWVYDLPLTTEMPTTILDSAKVSSLTISKSLTIHGKLIVPKYVNVPLEQNLYITGSLYVSMR